jgi:hypothetical protein
MRIRARIASTQAISTSLSDINRIRLSSPAIPIKPNIFLSDLTDVNTVGASGNDALIFLASTKNFTPTDITNIREEITTVNKLVGGFF